VLAWFVGLPERTMYAEAPIDSRLAAGEVEIWDQELIGLFSLGTPFPSDVKCAQISRSCVCTLTGLSCRKGRIPSGM